LSKKKRRHLSLDEWRELGDRILNNICQRVPCTPREEKCRKCPLWTVSDNIDFRYEMGWYNALKSYVEDFYKKKNDYLNQIRRLIVEGKIPRE